MKIWNVTLCFRDVSVEDFGTFPTKEMALAAAKDIMKSDQNWLPDFPSHESDNEIHFGRGSFRIVVESIYVA